MHHSDRGCQYASHAFRARLEEFGMLSSMTEELHCYENSVAERVNGILKGEYYLDAEFRDSSEALKAVRHVVDVYNNLRVHESLGMVTPAEARANPERVRDGVVAIQEAARRRREEWRKRTRRPRMRPDGNGCSDVWQNPCPKLRRGFPCRESRLADSALRAAPSGTSASSALPTGGAAPSRKDFRVQQNTAKKTDNNHSKKCQL